MKNFSLRIPTEQREEIAKIAKNHGLKDSDILRLAVRNFLKSQKRKKGAL
jgi:predicted DNA-binding protein